MGICYSCDVYTYLKRHISHKQRKSENIENVTSYSKPPPYNPEWNMYSKTPLIQPDTRLDEYNNLDPISFNCWGYDCPPTGF
jgi:hypothetical protein